MLRQNREWVAGRAFRRMLKKRQAASVPTLRPPPHFRGPPRGRRRAHHLRKRPARPRHADDDPTVLREWIPSRGRRWVEVIHGAELRSEANFGTRIWNESGPATPIVAQPPEKLGEPSGTRTRDPLIKRSIMMSETLRTCG